MLAGFFYALLISGGAIKALSMALRSDWAVSRKWNYLLLVPPFALIAPFAVVAAVVAPQQDPGRAHPPTAPITE